MLITTTPGIEGRPVAQYLGVVTAQGVLGVNVFKDVGAGVRNIFGVRLSRRDGAPAFAGALTRDSSRRCRDDRRAAVVAGRGFPCPTRL
jgi:hypothetical protein